MKALSSKLSFFNAILMNGLLGFLRIGVVY